MQWSGVAVVAGPEVRDASARVGAAKALSDWAGG